MERQDEITTLVKDAFIGQSGIFRPCAFFDDRLDCIRIITKDCSILEERINNRVTILRDLYSPLGRKECVGFTIKGAFHFCQQHGWSQSRPIQMSKLLDAIVASAPEQAVRVFIDYVARPLVEAQNIDTVETDSDHTPASELQPA